MLPTGSLDEVPHVVIYYAVHYTTSCNTVYCSWGREYLSPETCRADWNC